MRWRRYLCAFGLLVLVPSELFAQPAPVNLAQGRAATQSSTYYGNGASNAVDANTTSGANHTSLDNEPWWEVDLGAEYSLQSVTVWNRLDCCGSRLSDFSVFVSAVPFTGGTIAATRGLAGVSEFATIGEPGAVTHVAVNRAGRYVRIQLPRTDYLHMAEVQVWGGPKTENVAWVAHGNTASAGSALWRTLTTWEWDAGAVSTRAIVSGDGYLEVTSTPDYLMFGLSNGNTNLSYDDIDYAIFTVSNGFYIYEGGVQRGGFHEMTSGDKLRVAVEDGVVRYRQNGVLIDTSTIPPAYPLLVDTALVYVGGIQEAVISGALITLTENVSWFGHTNASSSGSALWKTLASAAFDAGAVSTKAIASADGYVEVTAVEDHLLFGLSNGDTNASWDDVDYAYYIEWHTYHVWERGVYRGNGSMAPGDKMRVAVEGGVVKFRKNGELIHTSTVPPTYPLLVDTSLLLQGPGIQQAVISGTLVNAAVSPPVFSIGSGSYAAAQSVAISAAAGSTIHYTLNGTDPTEADLVVASGGTILMGTNTTLKAKAWAPGLLPSETTIASYSFSSSASAPATLGNGNSMPPVPGSGGRTIPAQGPDGPLDSSSGLCTSEVLTTFVPPTQTLKAVFYFPWHFSPNEGTCEGVQPGQICSKEYWPKCVAAAGLSGEKPGFQPAVGFYSSDEAVSPGITASHMATMAAAGVDVVAIEWTGIGKREETNSLPRVLNEAGSRGMKVALLYDLAIALNTTNINLDNQTRREQITGDFRHFRSQYFGRPEYLRIDGKPVVYLYISREISSANQHGIEEFFNALRADPSIGDIYLVADHLKAEGDNLESLRQIGAQAVTAFHGADRRNNGISVHDMADALSRDYYVRKKEGVLALNSVNIFPGVFPQYDDRSMGNCGRDGSTPDNTTQNYNLTSVEDWNYMLRKVGTDQRWNVKKIQIKRDCSEVPLAGQVETPSIMWVYSFNEWAEGSGIEPLLESGEQSSRYPWRFGSDLINALRDHSFASTSGAAQTLIPFARGPNGMQETQRPNFAWDGVHGADQFQLEVKDSSGSVAFSHEQSQTIVVPSANYEPGTYSWRVRARVNGSWAPWGSSKTFIVPEEGEPVCNSDGECDEASGETHLTCPSDCTGGIGSCIADGPATQSFALSPATIYAGQPVTFAAAMPPITVGTMPLWDVGTGDHFAGSPLTYTYNLPGTYSVTLTSNDANCQTTVLTTQAISVVPMPPQTCSDAANQINADFVGCGGWEQDCTNHPGASPAGNGSDCLGTVCCMVPRSPPPPPDTQSCGQLGGEVCSGTSSCPAGYSSLGTTRRDGLLECQTCCNQNNGDGYCEPNVEGCGTSPDCPCWMAGTTCSASGPSGQCVDRCSDPAFHNHSASCGETDECEHAIGSASECLPPCGGMGGNHCSETANWCPGGYGYLGQSNDCQSCCQLDPCASLETHDHGGSCGSEDSCGDVFGSNEDCGCPGAPTVFDTCWGEVCDTDWLWVPQLCDTCEQQCTTETSCSTVCDEFGCWDECVPYESCSQVCSSYECGGYWAPIDINCRWESYQCNPHQCGS
jgi:hypothetical protein